MVPRFCTHCGAPVIPNATFCSSCGTPVAGPAPSPPGTGVSPGFSSPYTYPYPPAYPTYVPVAVVPTPSMASQGADLKALSRVSTAAILGLISFALSTLVLAITPALAELADIQTGSTISGFTAGIVLILTILVGGIVLTLVQFLLFRSAYAELSPYDPSFHTPRQLTVVAIAGVILLCIGFVAFLWVYLQGVTCGAGPNATGVCLNNGEMLGVLALLLVAGVVAFVGVIGLAIGIWRLGTRYGEGLFKAGAILFFLFNLVGVILILVAAHSARRKFFESVAPSATFG